MPGRDAVETRRAEALAVLDGVADPEIDEAVTAMGFIESLEIDGDDLDVVLRLPTYWCAANFAWLMVSDMKAALDTLSWTRTVTIRLVDHFAAAEINRGVAEGRDFGGTFQGEARGDLSDLRRVFREKAFFGRQETLFRMLVACWGIERTLAVPVAVLEALAAEADGSLAVAASRYLRTRIELGLSPDGRAQAFTTPEGEAIPADNWQTHFTAARRLRRVAQANAEMCRLHLAARYEGTAPGEGTRLVKRTIHA